jgi:hypothetical protein
VSEVTCLEKGQHLAWMEEHLSCQLIELQWQACDKQGIEIVNKFMQTEYFSNLPSSSELRHAPNRNCNLTPSDNNFVFPSLRRTKFMGNYLP